MVSENDKNFSLFVGWLHISVSIVLPIAYAIIYASQYVDSNGTSPFITDEIIYTALLSICGFISWLILSILLLNGIQQNRPKLMVPWIFVNYLLIFVCCLFGVNILFSMSYLGGWWPIGFIEGFHIAVVFVFSVFCVSPIRKLYRELSITADILPTAYQRSS